LSLQYIENDQNLLEWLSYISLSLSSTILIHNKNLHFVSQILGLPKSMLFSAAATTAYIAAFLKPSSSSLETALMVVPPGEHT